MFVKDFLVILLIHLKREELRLKLFRKKRMNKIIKIIKIKNHYTSLMILPIKKVIAGNKTKSFYLLLSYDKDNRASNNYH